MFEIRKGWLRDLLLRGAGLCLLICCWLLMSWLFHSANLRHHDPTFVECAATAAGFLCFSAGATLASLGEHIFDQVEISERWAKPPDASPDTLQRASAAFLVVPEQDLIASLADKSSDEGDAIITGPGGSAKLP